MRIVADDKGATLSERLAAAESDVMANLSRLAAARAQLAETRTSSSTNRQQRELLHESAYARLYSRLQTMPVIEQAKGILMGQCGCTPDEAFTMLRSASQRMNVPVRELAADIVARVSSGQGISASNGAAGRAGPARGYPHR